MGNRRATSSAASPATPGRPRDAWALRAIVDAGLVPGFASAALADEDGGWLASAAVRLGADAERLAAVVAKAAHVPVAELGGADPAAAHFVPEHLARQYVAVPLAAANRTIRIATANPMDLDAEQALGFVAGRQVELRYALPAAILKCIGALYRPERSIERLVSGLATASAAIAAVAEATATAGGVASGDPVATLVDATIGDAVREGASELVFEPRDQGLVVRYRVDGVPREVLRLPRAAAGAVLRRLKAVAKLDVGGPRPPREGRATVTVDGQAWDLRFSVGTAARHGEAVTVRLLDPAVGITPLTGLGLWPDELAALRALLGRRRGIVLVAGPVGSGRTTTLYAALEWLRATGATIATVEDPVRCQLAGVHQIEVDDRQGVTFAGALRSVLQQAPDVILLGAIRDGDTARTAWQAALGGRLVLAALDATGTEAAVACLADLGVARDQVAAAVRGVWNQRLLRKLCPDCAAPAGADSLPPSVRPPVGFDRPVRLLAVKGCEACRFTGYRGRVAIAGSLAVDGAVADAIASGAGGEALAAAVRGTGMRSLREAGLRRVWVGETTYEEVLRATGDEGAPPAAAALGRGGPAARATEPGRQTPPIAVAPAAPPLVLIADDDPAMRSLMRTVLTSQGLRVAEAADGIAALEEAQRLHPALLLLDMDMPRLDGLGVLGTLRRRLLGRSVPVIVVTAHDDPAIETRCIELGAEDYITKPIQPASLVARTRAVLRRVGVI